MRSIDLYTAMRVVDDDILERSENAAYRQKKNRAAGVEAVDGQIAGDLCQEHPKHVGLLGRHRVPGVEPGVVDALLGVLRVVHYCQTVRSDGEPCCSDPQPNPKETQGQTCKGGIFMRSIPAAALLRAAGVEAVDGQIAGDLCQEHPQHIGPLRGVCGGIFRGQPTGGVKMGRRYF